ncbi:S-layer homology domain-containing protein [Fusibacter sp. Q10-2]|uniref:S-layer homology domain-containing protein n=1 Tax=Fusibacter ferrireducens TaxID=2785058 RepID=A0ABR9ZZW3_9FIRM|nr:S-layer homology domain-containing protein [Fusibacter ferrireducens]
MIPVTFTDGVGTANLKLNKADGQTLGFSLESVTTLTTNTLTITPIHSTAASIVVTQDVMAPTSNGSSFAQQPKVAVKDAFGNACTGDNTTVVTAAREDGGTWTLTGTTTATANAGVATFTDLGATNAALVNNAQLGFTATGFTKVTSMAVTLPAPAGSNDQGESEKEQSTITTPTTQPSQESASVIINGKEQEVGKEIKKIENGKLTVTIEVNNTVMTSKINETIKNNIAKTKNSIQVIITDTKTDVAKVELTGDIIKKLEENIFNVSVKRDNVEYVIPAEEFTIDKVAENLGVLEKDLESIKIEVRITKLDETMVAKYNVKAKANGAELVFPPTAFELDAKITKDDGTTEKVEISKFSNYVERVMEIPVSVDPNKITTGIVFNMDGTYSHIPTVIFQRNGKWYAKLNSLTNSNYSVIWNTVTVSSVENHWSKDVVNDMASRMIIFNPKTFVPDQKITRGDFAEYIVRALGLYRENSEYVNKYVDMSVMGDRTSAILIASEIGIVTGYTDGTFRPEALITREEAMTMYQKAMKITNLVGIDPNSYQSYSDFSKVSSWATNYVKEVLSAHVISGTTATTISPKSNLTYAEAAQAIKNLLVKSELINK